MRCCSHKLFEVISTLTFNRQDARRFGEELLLLRLLSSFIATDEPYIMPTEPTSISTSVGASGESTHPPCACITTGMARNRRLASRATRNIFIDEDLKNNL